MATNKLILESILWQAVRSPKGLIVKTNNPQSIKSRFSVIRRDLIREGHEIPIVITWSPREPESEIWLIKKEAYDEALAAAYETHHPNVRGAEGGA